MDSEKKPVVVDEGALRIAARLYERLDRDTERKGERGVLDEAKRALLGEFVAVVRTREKPHELIRAFDGEVCGVTLYFNQGRMLHAVVEASGRVVVKAGPGPYAGPDMKAEGESTVQLSWDPYRRAWATDIQDDEVIGFPGQPYPTMHPVKAIWQAIEKATRNAGW